MSGLIWIQTIWHSDGIPKEFPETVDFEEKKIRSAWKITQDKKN